MKTAEQLETYVPKENLMPNDVVNSKLVARYIAVPNEESTKMYVLDKELPCPKCGVKSMLRSWDPRRNVFLFHCEGCGIDLALTWAEVVVQRVIGKLRYTDGVLDVPDDLEIPELPEDPNSLTWESIKVLSGEEDTVSDNLVDITIQASGCQINNANEYVEEVDKSSRININLTPLTGKKFVIINDNIVAGTGAIVINGTSYNFTNLPSGFQITNSDDTSVSFYFTADKDYDISITMYTTGEEDGEGT